MVWPSPRLDGAGKRTQDTLKSNLSQLIVLEEGVWAVADGLQRRGEGPVVADAKPMVAAGAPDSPIEKFHEFLEARGEKLTQPRRAMIRHIFSSHKHFDADQLTADLRLAGQNVSRSTVYRTLRLLIEAGLLREMRLTNRTVYEHGYGYPSHDHLHCIECNGVIEFRDDAVRRLCESIGREHEFTVAGHRFVITGTCAKCAQARAGKG